MLIVNLEKLNEFGRNHSNARKSLAAWKMTVENTTWKNKQEVLNDFPKAKMIKNNRARFEIVHNIYRLIVFINYDAGLVIVRFIGTHNEYDRIDPETV